jgi:multisubunit Na+/H+ antiporter MnhG subunit
MFETSERYTVMRVIAPEEVWASLFWTYGALTIWRVFDTVTRVKTALAVNLFGCILWVGSTSAVVIWVGSIPPMMSGSIIIAVSTIWIVARTAIGGRSESGKFSN